MSRFAGKVVLITGGSSGIGYEISKRMAQEGGKIIIASIDKNIGEVVEQLREGGKYQVEGIPCDTTKKEDRKRVVDHIENKYGVLDVLVLNQGIASHKGRQLKITEKVYDQLFDVNVKSSFFFIQEIVHLLKLSKQDPNILLTSSITAVHPNRWVGVYAMTKACLVNMADWLSQELMSDSIRVNTIAPSATKTPMIQKE
jgi:dehydrogenase/reductase SDR family protein 4